MDDVVQTLKQTPYWLLVRDTEDGSEVFTTKLSNGGGRMLSVFSFEEEAEMFLCFRGTQDDWQTRELSPEGLRSLFYTVLDDVVCVTLDPIPENSFLDTSALLNVTRQDFIARLEGSTVRAGLFQVLG